MWILFRSKLFALRTLYTASYEKLSSNICQFLMLSGDDLKILLKPYQYCSNLESKFLLIDLRKSQLGKLWRCNHSSSSRKPILGSCLMKKRIVTFFSRKWRNWVNLELILVESFTTNSILRILNFSSYHDGELFKMTTDFEDILVNIRSKSDNERFRTN